MCRSEPFTIKVLGVALLHRVCERTQVLHRGEIDVIGRSQQKPCRAQGIDAPPNFRLDLPGLTIIPERGGAHGSPQRQPIPKFLFDGGGVHTVGLDGVDDIDADLHQVREEAGEVAITVVKDQKLRRLFPGDANGICQPGFVILTPHVRAYHQLARRGHVIIQEQDIDPGPGQDQGVVDHDGGELV